MFYAGTCFSGCVEKNTEYSDDTELRRQKMKIWETKTVEFPNRIL